MWSRSTFPFIETITDDCTHQLIVVCQAAAASIVFLGNETLLFYEFPLSPLNVVVVVVVVPPVAS